MGIGIGLGGLVLSHTARIRGRLLALASTAVSVLAITPLVATPIAAGATPVASAASTPTAASATSCPSRAPSPPTPQSVLQSTQLVGPAAIGSFFVTGQTLGVVRTDSRTLVSIDTSDLSTTTAPIDAPDVRQGWEAIDSTGSMYVLRYPYTVARLDAAGNDVWSYTQAQPLRAVFTFGSGADERIGLEYRDQGAALTLTTSGTTAGEIAVSGDTFGRTASAGTIATDGGRYVRLFDATGTQRTVFGDSHKDNDPNPTAAPLHFYQLGGAAELPDGRFLVTDTQRGLLLFSASGIYLGAVAPSQLSPNGLTQQSSVAVIGNDVYIAVGGRWTSNQYVIRLSLADVLARVAWTSANSRLGFGAGLVTGQPGDYTPFGQTPAVRAVFDPWWQAASGGMVLCWNLRSEDDLRSGRPGQIGALAATQWTYGSAGTPLPLPNLQPGAYTVDASLLAAGVPVSSTSLIMTVGASGQRLSLADLPPGSDWGGPAPARGLALTDEFGTKTFRDQLDWNRLLDNGADSPLDFSYYDSRFAAAAAEAARRGDTFIVQVGQGGPEKSLVSNGTWEARVREVVAHFQGVVHTWEAWNEPNITFGGASDFVAQVLAPFYRAVKAVDPTARVIGGSVVGVDVPYWKGIIAAGGLNDLDIASVHPYPGHNRAWEEQGTIPQLRELKSLLVRDGTPVPLWITELAWWSDGAANLFRQADASARALLWMADVGIEKWAYFIPEGGWGNDGVTFSAIQVNDYVKPAALALMTTTSQLSGRPFLGEVSLGAPAAYALRFGSRAGDPASGELLVAWTDEVDLPFVLSADQPGRVVQETEELGASQARTLAAPTPLTLTGSPTFLAVTGAGQLTLTPSETFGIDVAAAKAGATATASSSVSANPPSSAIDGDAGAAGRGDLPGMPAWASAPGDAQPTLTIGLGHAQTLDRVLIATHSLGSVVPGLRDYDVQVRPDPSAPWRTVATIRGQFYSRQQLVTFPAQTVAGIRLIVTKLNYSGTNEDGSRPAWWSTDPQSLLDPGSMWYGPAVVSELYAFAPGATTSAMQPITLTVSAPRMTLLVGSRALVNASLAGRSGGVAGQRVDLVRNGAVVATATSSASGAAPLSLTVQGTATYTVQVAGDAAYLPAVSSAFTIRASDRTRSTLGVARSFSHTGAWAIVIGRVSWATSGQPISGARIELWGYRSRWTRITTKYTNSTGRAAFWLPRVGPRAYKIVFRGKLDANSLLALPSYGYAPKIPVR